MVTVDLPGLPRTTRPGDELFLIVRINLSSPSSISSSFIGTSNETLVTPAGNVTVYGPES